MDKYVAAVMWLTSVNDVTLAYSEWLNHADIHNDQTDINIHMWVDVNCRQNDVGIQTINAKMFSPCFKGSEILADNLAVDVHTMQIIIDGLKNPSSFDIRSGELLSFKPF